MKGYLNLHQTCEALGVKRTTLYKSSMRVHLTAKEKRLYIVIKDGF